MQRHAIVDLQHLCSTIFDLSKYCKAMIKENVEGITQNNKKYYTYIPIDFHRMSQIIGNLMEVVPDFNNKQFIDIGCGVPAVPTIFASLGCIGHGLEYNKDYCEIFKGLQQGDLLTYDFKEYDILYAYNPIYDMVLMNKGLLHIIRSMKIGATFAYAQASGVCDVAKRYLKMTEDRSCYLYTKKEEEVMPDEKELISFTDT